MAKLFTFLILIIGLMILFTAAGLPTLGSRVLTWIGVFEVSDVSDITIGGDGTLWSTIATGLLIALAAVGITAGVKFGIYGGFTVTKTSVLAVAAIPLAWLIGDLIMIITTLNTDAEWLGWLSLLIILPIVIGYILALVDWVLEKG